MDDARENFENELDDLIVKHDTLTHNEMISVLELKLYALRDEAAANAEDDT